MKRVAGVDLPIRVAQVRLRACVRSRVFLDESACVFGLRHLLVLARTATSRPHHGAAVSTPPTTNQPQPTTTNQPITTKQPNNQPNTITTTTATNQVNQSTNFSELLAEHPWLNQAKLVVKPDMLFGQRGKNDLVGLDLTFSEAEAFVRERMGREVTIKGLSGAVTTFVVEPFVPHDEEYYLCIQSGRLGLEVSFSPAGGVEIEENWDKVKTVELPTGAAPTSAALAPLVATLPLELRPRLEAFVRDCVGVFEDLDCTMLEMNPFTLDPASGELRLKDVVFMSCVDVDVDVECLFLGCDVGVKTQKKPISSLIPPSSLLPNKTHQHHHQHQNNNKQTTPLHCISSQASPSPSTSAWSSTTPPPSAPPASGAPTSSSPCPSAAPSPLPSRTCPPWTRPRARRSS